MRPEKYHAWVSFYQAFGILRVRYERERERERETDRQTETEMTSLLWTEIGNKLKCTFSLAQNSHSSFRINGTDDNEFTVSVN